MKKEKKPTIEELRAAFRSATEKARRRRPPQWKTKTCERCGVEISVLWMRQKYCDDCAKGVKREMNSASTKSANEKRKAKAAEKREKKKPHVSRIDDILQAARKAGMSYGRYVAMIAMKKEEETKC